MRVCMIAYKFYENEDRGMRYSEKLAIRGCVVSSVIEAVFKLGVSV